MTKAEQREGSCAVAYEPSASAFILRIFGNAADDVAACLRRYEVAVEEKSAHRQFNVIINMDEKAHSSLTVLRLIRVSLEKYDHRERLTDVVAVHEDPNVVAMRNASGGYLACFADEDQASQYLASRMRETGHA